MDSKEIIKKQLAIVTPDLKAFLLAENWRKDVETVGKQFNLSEEKLARLENEAFLVLLCLEPKNDFLENIQKGLALDTNMAGWVAEDINRKVFSLVEKEMDITWQKVDDSELEATKPKNVGNDFEQIILNQARAMQGSKEAPDNLPTGESVVEANPNRTVHDYKEGNDPYREPIA